MIRSLSALLAGLLLVQAGASRAADEPPAPTPTPAPAPAPAGSWKLTMPYNPNLSWLVKFESKDGKWTGTATAGAKTPDGTVEDVAVADGVLHFSFKVPSQELTLPFEGALPKEGEKIRGTFLFGTEPQPVELQRSTLTSLDPYDQLKEDLVKEAGEADGVRTALTLLKHAAEKMAKPDEVRSWADKAVKWSEPYGERWRREITLQVAEILGDQKGFASTALQYARQAERSLDPKKDSAGLQRRVLRALAAALNASDKKDEAKDVEARLAKIPVVNVVPFPGRKAPGDRVALVELFTGAQCPPCVAADVGFDALTQAYKPTDVIFLEYHLHIPGPDPLTVQDNDERSSKYYKIEGTPTMFVNGKEGPAPGSRDEDDGQSVYDEYGKLIQSDLETPAKAKIKLTTRFADGKSHVRVEVEDLAETGDNVKLRIALVEPEVAYTGSNKVALHHDVVRAFVGEGGVNGMALKEKTGREVAEIDLNDVKKGIQDYLKTAVATIGPFSGTAPPVELKNLRLVVFIQNDDTREVLQAVETDLPTQ